MAIFIRGPLLGSGDGQSGENAQRSARYVAISDDGTDNEVDAEIAVFNSAPADWEGQGLDKVSSSVRSLGDSKWEVIVRYRPATNRIPQRPAAGDPTRFGFSTRGATENVKSSLQTVTSVKEPGQPDKSFGNLINVQGDSANGVDIVVASWVEPITRYLSDAEVDAAFRETIFNTTGKVNDDLWRDFEPGEVLFRGADGERDATTGVWEVSYLFEMRPNRTGVVVGGLPAVDINGHDYFWALTAPADTAGGLVLKPTHGYVERVLPRTAFAPLGIA